MTFSTGLVSLLTPRGRGAVATIAWHGEVTAIDAGQLFRAANGQPLAAQTIGRLVFGHWGSEPAEDVVVCRTATDRLEVYCHGGETAATRILQQFESIGATRLTWQELMEHAEGSFAADCARALSQASTVRTAAIIARQGDRPLRDALGRLAKTGFPENRDEIRRLLQRLNRWSKFGLHLTRPWRVVLYGPPNAGKSSLINALVGYERSIVFDQPGTTRDVVTAETAFDGWPLNFSDTAGLRAATEDLEAAGIQRAGMALADADLRLLVLDRSAPPLSPSEAGLTQVVPDLVVLNKSDLPEHPDFEHPDLRDTRLPTVTVSAKTRTGVPDLLRQITERLIPTVPAEHEPVPVTQRQVDALRSALDAVEAEDEASYRAAMKLIW